MRANLSGHGVYDSKLQETLMAAVLLSKALLDMLLSFTLSQLDKTGHVEGGMPETSFTIRKTNFPPLK